MPIIKSARKRVRIARRATIRNVRTKRNLKTAIKAVNTALTGGKKAADDLKKAQSAIDSAVKKGVIHKNKGARKKSQLAKAAKIAGVTVAAGAAAAAVKKKNPKKDAAKPAAKKSPAKKAAPSKKPAAARKTPAKTTKTASKGKN